MSIDTVTPPPSSRGWQSEGLGGAACAVRRRRCLAGCDGILTYRAHTFRVESNTARLATVLSPGKSEAFFHATGT